MHAHVICTKRVDKTGVSGHHGFKNGRKCSLCKPHPSRCPRHVNVLWPRLSHCMTEAGTGGGHSPPPHPAIQGRPPFHIPDQAPTVTGEAPKEAKKDSRGILLLGWNRSHLSLDKGTFATISDFNLIMPTKNATRFITICFTTEFSGKPLGLTRTLV